MQSADAPTAVVAADQIPADQMGLDIGPRTVEQLDSAVRAAAIELDQATLDRLDDIFPGPGGEAPKAYAW